MLGKALGIFFEILQTFVLSAAIFVIIYLFAAQPHLVKGSSMEPNLLNGDYILTEKISSRFGDPQRGEVIVFKAPNRPDTDYIKRVIGLPGERIKVENGKIFINGKQLDESYEPSDFMTYSGRFLSENEEFLVPADEFFVLGDNRSQSSDSREFGPIPKSSIIGHALIRYWPIVRAGVIKMPHYYYYDVTEFLMKPDVAFVFSQAPRFAGH